MVYGVSFLWFRSLNQCPQGRSQQRQEWEHRTRAGPPLQQEAVRLTQLRYETASASSFIILCSSALLLRENRIFFSLVGVKLGMRKESNKDCSNDHRSARLGACQLLAVPLFTQHPPNWPKQKKRRRFGGELITVSAAAYINAVGKKSCQRCRTLQVIYSRFP